MSKTFSPLLLVGLLAGASIAIQAGINAKLRNSLSSPFQAALVSFLVGTAALGIIVIASGAAWPSQLFRVTPWWAWTGGLLGAFYITTAVLLAPRVGSLALAAIIITGQLLAALVLDHFGLLAFSKVPLSPARITGAVFLVIGVLLIIRRGH